ncbi:tRNA-specific adenosine deaminase [Methylobacterium jeotgali]|uniref:tRNA-specific adenosine deaminase n=1 Tax=Methylobacterium jeotgali TaxID=381630 RepID=A0ABQ4SQA2_9HYPH|nr:anti-phage dCTP deaminase [Methylobacterium jeotgali]GBU15900.1 cytidine deaminase [Methylobacterium sp.]GJE05355.1 tRNA-specific adenosine deaminase [Methylobacterium jeotgali]
MAKAGNTKLKAVPDAADAPDPSGVSPLSKELVIGIVGFAGSGCSTAVKRLQLLLEVAGYDVEPVKLSTLIERQFAGSPITQLGTGVHLGPSRFARACDLQNLGDELRKAHGNHAVAALAVREIMKLRGEAVPGERKLAVILDSIKHSDEVKLLQNVYGQSFRLVATHCEPANRERRLIGAQMAVAKYRGVDREDVLRYMERDEKDVGKPHGQQVRDAFHLADFFIDNNEVSQEGENLTDDLRRFTNLLLGTGLVRPTRAERAIKHAYAAARQSSCLSRQVGAALTAEDGTIVSTGTNDPPAFGGGVYDEDSPDDNRCSAWRWTGEGGLQFVGCHNTRKKNNLRNELARWMATNLSADLALAAHPVPETGIDVAKTARERAQADISAKLIAKAEIMGDMPGVKDLIEYSRSIHAEMDALFSAARKGVSPVGTTLYCTTYPCHNCARHLVTAGVERVYYVEPYKKSLASELHSDAIANELPRRQRGGSAVDADKMVVVPFTGVGVRMYEDFFVKRAELKNEDGSYRAPVGGIPEHAVRLRALESVEEKAAALVPEKRDA